MNWATTNTEVPSIITHALRALNIYDIYMKAISGMVCDSLESRTNSREGVPATCMSLALESRSPLSL